MREADRDLENGQKETGYGAVVERIYSYLKVTGREGAHYTEALEMRQVEAAKTVVPRDRLKSGGLGPEMVKILSGRFLYEGVEPYEWVNMGLSQYPGMK